MNKNGTSVGKVFVGSAKELAGKITINGKRVSAPELSILSTLGIAVVQEKVKSTSGRGKPTNILRLRSGRVSIVVDMAEPTDEPMSQPEAVESHSEVFAGHSYSVVE